jgi:hypothetical protein
MPNGGRSSRASLGRAQRAHRADGAERSRDRHAQLVDGLQQLGPTESADGDAKDNHAMLTTIGTVNELLGDGRISTHRLQHVEHLLWPYMVTASGTTMPRSFRCGPRVHRLDIRTVLPASGLTSTRRQAMTTPIKPRRTLFLGRVK